ncbi:MAG: hypothetical protein E7L15_17475 [Citrobacter portucalensis]|nr:hypothetical protein [Citrobacter portucalensis]
MIYKRGWLKTVSRYDMERKLKDAGVGDASKVINVIYGIDHDNPEHHVIDKDWFYHDDVKVWQRLNQLWVVPLLIITIPFQWFFKGYIGFKNESMLGKFLGRITGLK